jgi:uncharacterized glyoxalase superfamily protein PhnB
VRTTATPSVTFLGVSPYLYYEDAAAALEWLTRMFGFEERERYVDSEGRVQEAEIAVGNATIMMAGGRGPEPGEGAGQLLIVHVDDVDAHHRRATAAGLAAPAPRDQEYGPRTYTVTDPWGYQWTFWQHVREFVQGTRGLQQIRA